MGGSFSGRFKYLLTDVPPVLKHRRILGEAIRVRRKVLKWSQEKLAEKAELNPKYVSEVERGTKTISVDGLIRIAGALDISLHELVGAL